MLNRLVQPIDLLVINWEDRAKVIALAKKLGPGHTVVKHSTGRDYNIVRTSRVEQYRKNIGEATLHIIFRT